MENRKYVKFLIPVFILGFLIANVHSVFAYDVETHAFLTSEIVKFYNQNFSNDLISSDLTPYIIDGSRREDDTPRWMNHFYDPVYNRGLSYDPKIDPLYTPLMGNWQESKDWAQDSNNQNSLTYKVPTIIASILTALEQGKISAITAETEFTWQKAISLYAAGQKEQAMFTLGHILHLIEDISVPDHTRNDPHVEGSPYESYAQKFNLSTPDKNLDTRLTGKNPIVLADLNSYFDGMATYSNNNFYSKDTIGIQSGYNLPQPDYFQTLEDGRSYGIHPDNDFGNYPIVMAKGLLGINTSDELLNRPPIMSAYWSRLSTKSVEYGAGIINLFIQQAEAAKSNQNTTQIKSFLSQIIDAISNFFSSIFGSDNNQNFQPAAQISLDQNSDQTTDTMQTTKQTNTQTQTTNHQINQTLNPASTTKKTKTQTPLNQIQTDQTQNDNQDENLQDQQVTFEDSSTNQSQTASAASEQCSFTTSQSPSHQGVIINEVAWMGSLGDANNEWIELKNISSADIDITNWQLLNKAEKIKINFSDLNGSKIIKSGQFILLERTDDNSVPNITADLIYTGAISNSNEGLRLFDNQCNLIDETLASPNWPAGDNTTKKTMERDSGGFNWHTSNDSGGTPKKENSISIYSDNGTGNAPQSQDTNTQTQQSAATKILITELQITGGVGKTNNDFIELYNPNNFAVNLKGYRLVKRTKTGSNDTSIKSWTADTIIPAYSYYLWANSNYTDISSAPDITTTATISSDNGVAIRFGSEDTGTIIDSVAWGEAQNTFIEGSVFAINPGANQSIQRKFQNNTFVDTDNNAQDFEIQSCPSPKAQSRNYRFGAVQNFNIAYSSNTMELIFNWQSPERYTNSTSTLTYKIIEINNPSSTLSNIETISTNAAILINEIGRDYQFSIQPFDEDGFSSQIVSSTISVPSFLSGLYFYQDPRDNAKNLVEAYYNQYPFVPDLFGQNRWRLVVFYLNSDARNDLNNSFWQPNDLTNVLATKYDICAGGTSSKYSLLLPDSQNYCNVDGGAYNATFNFSQLEDNHFIIQTASSSQDMNLSGNDFITVAFYSVRSIPRFDGTAPSFQLVAIDKIKYDFGNLPTYQPPQLNGPINLNFATSSSRLILDWPKATDPDTLDYLLTYEIKYNDADPWQSLDNSTGTSKLVSPGDNFSISLRVKDDFNDYSTSTLIASWSYPATTFYITQTATRSWSNQFGVKNENCPSCPDSISLQTITPQQDFQFNKIILKLKQGDDAGQQINDYANIYLSVYQDNVNQPDFNNKLGESTISNLFNPDENQDITFSFSSPVSLTQNNQYWLILNIANYNWNQSIRNVWRNEINVGNDNYFYGTAGYGEPAFCDINYQNCSFRIPRPDATADWYMKIGLGL